MNGTPVHLQKGFTVKYVCQSLGLTPATLRAWENRYSIVTPFRSRAGQRRYSQEDLQFLSSVVGLVNQGHSISSVSTLTAREIKLLSKENEVAGESATSRVWDEFFPQFHGKLKKFDLDGISELMTQKRTALGARAFLLNLVAPLLQWMGEVVADSNLLIAHEHALGAVIRDQLYRTMTFGKSSKPAQSTYRFILATPEDDLHEFGIVMAAALLNHYQIPCHLLGANLPANALVEAVKGIKATTVILGNSPIPDSERAVTLEKFLTDFHKSAPKNIELWIGGRGRLPHLRSVLAGRQHRTIQSMQELDHLLARL